MPDAEPPAGEEIAGAYQAHACRTPETRIAAINRHVPIETSCGLLAAAGRYAMTTNKRFVRSLIFATVLVLGTIPANAATLPVAEMDRVLGEKGDALGQDVVRYWWLRSDLKVVIDHLQIEPALALKSWAAFMPAGAGNAIATGELVARQSEAERVVQAFDISPLHITAICDHLQGESPRLSYLHFVGRGKPLVLAKALRKVLDAAAMPLKAAPAVIPAMPVRWVDEIRLELGYSGLYQNGVLSIAVRRSNEVRLYGNVLPPSMGISTLLNFQAAGPDRIATAGSIVLAANEVPQVLYSLSSNHIEITALTSHMFHESPRLFYVHFFAVGAPDHVAWALRAALYRTRVGGER
jgi:hypothetical protein